MPLTLKQLCNQLGCEFEGESELEITGVASLASAQSGDLCFLQQGKYLAEVSSSLCSVIIVAESMRSVEVGRAVIFAENPQLTFAAAIELISPQRLKPTIKGIHPSAQIAESAKLGDDVTVGALCVIGERVEIGVGTQVGAGCIIEDDASLGDFCLLHSRVTIARRVEIGKCCILHSGAVIGADGFGLIEANAQWHKIPQIGSVIIGDDVEIGANTTIDRGALDNTILESGCKLDNLIQVAHNVRIGEHTAIAACVGIAGSTEIGRYCKISGAAVIIGHLSIADHVTITAMSMVTKDIKKPGVYSSGMPLLENREWHRNSVRYKSLDKLAKTVARLDKKS